MTLVPVSAAISRSPKEASRPILLPRRRVRRPPRSPPGRRHRRARPRRCRRSLPAVLVAGALGLLRRWPLLVAHAGAPGVASSLGSSEGGPDASGRVAAWPPSAPHDVGRIRAGHHPSDGLLADRHVEGADQAAVVHDGDPVGEGEHLVEFGGDEQHRGALIALGDELGVDVLDRADVDTSGRLRRDEQVDRAIELAGDDELLLVAAGQGAGRRGDRRGADVEGAHELLGVGVDGRELQRAALGVRLGVPQVEHEVLRDGEVATSPSLLRSSGHVSDPIAQHLLAGGAGDVAASDRDPSRPRSPRAR
jgi:hypothetical protein